MRSLRTLLRVSPLLVLAGTLLAADGPQLIMMDDIANWQAEVFAGNVNCRGFTEGPKLATALSGIIVFDSKGDAYVACETFVAVVTKDGQARVLTGQQGLTGNSDGPPGRATFGNAIDIAIANDNLLYVVDGANFTLREIRREKGVWITQTVAGVPGVKGHRDGPGKQAMFTSVFDSLTMGDNGEVYLWDGDWLRKFDKGVLTTLNPEADHVNEAGVQSPSGYRNGPLKGAQFSHSQGRQHGLTTDGKGNLYVADKVNMAIRKVDLVKGEVTTFAGVSPGEAKTPTRDGPALFARFHPGGGPNMIFYNKKLDSFICRSDDESVIRIIQRVKDSPDNWQVRTFGPEPSKTEKLTGPWKDVAGGTVCGIDADGNVYVQGSSCIRVVKKVK